MEEDNQRYRYFEKSRPNEYIYCFTQSSKEAVDLFMANWEEIDFLTWVNGIQNG